MTTTETTLWTPTTTTQPTARPPTRPPAAPRRPPRIAGPDVGEGDERRLLRQLDRVRAAMTPGTWITLRVLAERAGGTEPSVSARLRDLRREGCDVQRRRTPTRGVFEYSVRPDGGRALGRAL